MSKKAEGFSLRFVLINTGNISRKVLSKVLRSFDKNFERLQQLEVFDTAGNKEVRYLLKEELEKELERKKLLPEKKGKHKNRIFETQKQTENGTHGEKQKKAGFLQKETNSLSNEPERQEQEKDRDEGQMTVTVVFIVLSGLSGMLYWVKHRQKVQI